MESKYHIPAIFILVAIIFIFIPLMMIWSLNTLFLLGIAYNFWTWLGSLFLLIVFIGGSPNRQ